MLLRRTPLTAIQARRTPLPWILDDLRNALPHVSLPRFPPAVWQLLRGVQGNSGQHARGTALVRRKRKGHLATRDVDNETDVIALESTDGRKRVYKWRKSGDPDGSFEMVQEHQSSGNTLRRFWSSFLVPQGYPDSVSPQYRDYMAWRGVQYFFGGALSLFTTRSLLAAVGVRRGASASAAAINWVLKDGAGRLGRCLFARWGTKLDCELKQFRLMGDGLMEAGAILELSTKMFPRHFLLLACTANLMKNVAAVAASSTRAPIYRTFALHNNMADVTAKGESVANLSDVLGVAFGIAVSKLQLPMAVTFAMLSAGYLVASRNEVDSVLLPYMNQARLAYAMDRFLSSGDMPSVFEGNKREPLLPIGPKWSGYGQVILGASLERACETPAHLADTLAAFPAGSPYLLSYRPDKGKVFVILRQHANKDDALDGAFVAHVWLRNLQETVSAKERKHMPALPRAEPSGSSADANKDIMGGATLRQAMRDSAALWRRFAEQSEQKGWCLKGTMLAIGNTRLQTIG